MRIASWRLKPAPSQKIISAKVAEMMEPARLKTGRLYTLFATAFNDEPRGAANTSPSAQNVPRDRPPDCARDHAAVKITATIFLFGN
jgi:hypothetical protein